jgi:hypothetical protein
MKVYEFGMTSYLGQDPFKQLPTHKLAFSLRFRAEIAGQVAHIRDFYVNFLKLSHFLSLPSFSIFVPL